MIEFIEYVNEVPTVCGDPILPRCYKGTQELNGDHSTRCVFTDGHGGCCQYNTYTGEAA